MRSAALQARGLCRQYRLSHTSHNVARTVAARLNAFTNEEESGHKSGIVGKAERTELPSVLGEIAFKDNIATTAATTTVSSDILRNYTSPYDASVVQQLLRSGGREGSKANMDEFGMGSHSQTPSPPVESHLKRDGEVLSPGGSSGGSAIAVALGACDVALGTDTGGSVRLPAAYTGIVGFKPSYGLLSRWGVVAYANSLDTVGVLAKDVQHARTLFDAMNTFDSKDPTAIPMSVRQRIHDMASSRPERKLRIGVPLEYIIEEVSSVVRQAWTETLARLIDNGHMINTVSLPTTRQALSAYYVLAPAEASSNLAKYDGIRYGTRTSGSDASPKEGLPLYARTRGEGFGEEVKRRILLGAYTLSSEATDNYFIQAQKVRRLVQLDFDRVFAMPNPMLAETANQRCGRDSVDVVITPTAPTLPPTIKEVRKQTSVESYMNDVFTVPASLAGLPAISVPVGLPDAEAGSDEIGVATRVTTVGMQIIGQFGDDELVLKVAEIIEKMQTQAG